METIPDFEDILAELEQARVEYLIVGGMAFIYHAKPRYTKDIDIWVNPELENVKKANMALAAFGAPYLISIPVQLDEIIQLGLPPNRIDILLTMQVVSFPDAWQKRIHDQYGNIDTNWIDMDSLIMIKEAIDSPKHQEDARILKEVKRRKSNPHEP